MKKLILPALFLLFGTHVNAQDYNFEDSRYMYIPPAIEYEDADNIEDPVALCNIVSYEQAAADDIAALLLVVPMEESLQHEMFDMMVLKHQTLADDGLSAAEKSDVSAKYSVILLDVLDATQKS